MNNSAVAVRKHAITRDDPRVERTKRALGAALVELMLERGFDDISVRDVLERAGIARATFYAHFRNKRDLFLSGYERMLGGMERHLAREGLERGRVVPVAEFFAHVGGVQPLIAALRVSGQLDLIWDIGGDHFARMIERRLALLTPKARMTGMRAVISAKFCAGALVEMLKWWLDRDERPTPEQMDELYHDMVRKALSIGTQPQ